MVQITVCHEVLAKRKTALLLGFTGISLLFYKKVKYYSKLSVQFKIMSTSSVFVYLCFWDSFEEIFEKKAVFLFATKRLKTCPHSSWLRAF